MIMPRFKRCGRDYRLAASAVSSAVREGAEGRPSIKGDSPRADVDGEACVCVLLMGGGSLFVGRQYF
jgi:hypothetical protein